MKQCLETFIEQTDQGAINPLANEAQERFAIADDGVWEEDDGFRAQYFKCALGSCANQAMFEVSANPPRFSWVASEAENALPEEKCGQGVSHEAPFLPKMTSQKGCLSAATSRAVNRLGVSLSPDKIDAILSREEGVLPTQEGQDALHVDLLERGFALEFVFPANGINFEDYYREDSTLTYDDYAKAVMELVGGEFTRQWLETTFTQASYNELIQQRRRLAVELQSYKDSGRLKATYTDISTEDISKRLNTESLMAEIMVDVDGIMQPHEVCVERIIESPNGTCALTYFDPGFERPSAMRTVRGRAINKSLMLNRGLLFISKPEATPVAEK